MKVYVVVYMTTDDHEDCYEEIASVHKTKEGADKDAVELWKGEVKEFELED